MPAVVPHLESADPTEADDDDAVDDALAVADDDEDDAAADNTPESRQDFTPSRTEREGMERKGKERNVIKLFLRALQMIINHFGIKIPCGVLSLICCCCYTHTCARACVCVKRCASFGPRYITLFSMLLSSSINCGGI